MESTMKCPNCGAQVAFGDNSPIAECKYCDSIIVREIDTSSVSDSDKGVMETANVQLRVITPDDKFKARYELGDIDQRGKLWLTSVELLFKPNSLNKGDKSIRYIPISEIENITANESEYWFAKRIIIRLKDKTFIAVHIEKSVCNSIIEGVKQRKTLLNKRTTSSIPIDYGRYNGAKKASEIAKYKDSILMKSIKSALPILFIVMFIIHKINKANDNAIFEWLVSLGIMGKIVLVLFVLLIIVIAIYQVNKSRL